MKFHYHPDTDSLYIHLNDDVSVESEEVAANIVFDYDANGVVVGIDIDHASTVVNLENVEVMFPKLHTLVTA
jgi:uncharacterized protein YuzE